MTIPINIRAVRSGDWAKLETLVAGICRAHGETHGLTRATFDAFAVGPQAPMTVLVAETEQGILAGYVAGHPVYAFQEGVIVFEIQNIYVAPEFRRNRIGEVLMIRIIQDAVRKHGATRIKLGARAWNREAIEFYKQLGFSESTQSKETVRLSREVA